jgi:hypothetical protein
MPGFVGNVPTWLESAASPPRPRVLHDLCVKVPASVGFHECTSLKTRAKLGQRNFFKISACALFQVPYPLSPFLATLTKTAGVYTNNSHFGTHRLRSPLLSPLFLFKHSRGTHFASPCFDIHPWNGGYESVWQLGLTLPLYCRERRSAGWPIFWSTTRSKPICCHRQ